VIVNHPSREQLTMAAEDKTATLQDFQLDDLAGFKREQQFRPDDSPHFRVFYVGRDDVHGVLAYLIGRASRSFYFNMFGYDDDALDAIIRGKIEDEHVYVQGTIDRSQAGGVHEKSIIGNWSDAVRASIVEGQSATHQISHTKGGVVDGIVGFEGSTNWSASGEGTFVQPGVVGGRGYKAQNNTLMVATHPVFIAEFTAELNEEHAIALQQQAQRAAKENHT
jgi:hypothetical protein